MESMSYIYSLFDSNVLLQSTTIPELLRCLTEMYLLVSVLNAVWLATSVKMKGIHKTRSDIELALKR